METLVSLAIVAGSFGGLVFYFVRGSRRSADDRFAARHRATTPVQFFDGGTFKGRG